MYEALKLVVSPLLAITLLALGDGYFTTFVSVRLTLEGWSEVSIGCVQSAYFLGQCIGAWRNKRLILRVGFIRSLCVFASILAASILIQAQGPHIIVLALLRFIGGVSIVGIYIIGESWILRMSSHTTRGVILSLYMISYYGAFVISQSIFDHIDVRSLSPYLFTATMISLCSLPVALTRVTSPDFGTPPRLSVKELMKGSTLGFFGCGLAGMLLAAVYAFMPIFAHESGYSVSKIMVSTIGGGVLFQWPIGKLSDLIDRRLVASGLGLGLVISSLLLATGNHGGGDAIYWMCALMGGFIFAVYPLSIAQTCDRLAEEEYVSATGALLIVCNVGTVISPWLVSVLMQYLSSTWLFLYIATLGLIFGTVSLVTRLFHSRVPEEERVHFIPLPGESVLAYQLEENPEELRD